MGYAQVRRSLIGVQGIIPCWVNMSLSKSVGRSPWGMRKVRRSLIGVQGIIPCLVDKWGVKD